jgi:uncharacterized protein
MNKELFSIFSSRSGQSYCYNIPKQYLSPLSELSKYILDNHLHNGIVDENGCFTDPYLQTQDKEMVNYYIQKNSFLSSQGFFESQNNQVIPFEIDAKTVLKGFTMSNSICFEVTERCNLRCEYCIYGKYYNHYDQREGVDMSFNVAKTFLDYKINLWLSENNTSHNNVKLIGFYGGEPLVNIKLIQQIVEYVKDFENKYSFKFRFQMTTNGTLLDKYQDFLIKNDFLICISLDGDKDHNQYRVFKNNKPTFSKVMRNIRMIEANNKLFFDSNISFFSVLHNKSNIYDIANFFSECFKKYTGMSPLNPIGDIQVMKQMSYKGIEVIQSSRKFKLKEDNSELFSRNKYLSHHVLLYQSREDNKLRTGTCLPFSKRTFITARGNILMCEKILHLYKMGKVEEGDVYIDFVEASKIYNNRINEMFAKCICCFMSKNCTKCILSFRSNDCSGFVNKEQFKSYIAEQIFQYEQR